MIKKKVDVERLEEYIRLRNLTLSELQSLSGLSYSTIRRVLAGEGVTLKTIGKIATALNLRPTDILQGGEDNAQS